MELISKINIGEYIKKNIKNIISIFVLLIATAIFLYSIYLFYDVALVNKRFGDNMLINTKKDATLDDEILLKIQENKEINKTLNLKLLKLSDPFK